MVFFGELWGVYLFSKYFELLGFRFFLEESNGIYSDAIFYRI